MKLSAQDWYLAHPRIDYVAPLLALLLAALAGRWVDIAEYSSVAVSAAVAASALAGLSMASSAFICTLVYQSTHSRVVKARLKHATTARRNWVAIIGSTFASALVPLVSLLLVNTSVAVVIGCTIGGLALLVARFIRSLAWMSLTLFAIDEAPPVEAQQVRYLRPTA